MHAIAWWLARRPDDAIGYASYSGDFAHSKSKLTREYAQRAGVELRDDLNTAAEWRTPNFGGLLAAGVGGPFTGHGFKLIVVDDPFKNREEAESPVIRQKVWEWFTSTVLTRLEPGGSIIIVHTRWHPDDLIGRCHNQKEFDFELPGGRRLYWRSVNLPAINEEVQNDNGVEEPADPRRELGEALWPQRWPVERLAPKKANAYDWASMYQGRPRPKGGRVFELEPPTYDTIPNMPMVAAFGFDLAYSDKKTSDFSGGILMAIIGMDYYVLDFEAKQCPIEEFPPIVQRVTRTHPNARRFGWIGSTEVGVVQLLNKSTPEHPSCRLTYEFAVSDKFVRAQPVAADWNAGRIFLPRNAPWVPAFLQQMQAFTGLKDLHDDFIDMIAAAHHVLKIHARPIGQPSGLGPRAVGKKALGGRV